MLYRSYRYAKWDGTQRIFEFDASTLMDSLSEDFLKRGDISSALRDMLRNGVKSSEQDGSSGLRDLMEQVKNRRRQELQKHNLDSIIDDLSQKLDHIIETERGTIHDRSNGSDRDDFNFDHFTPDEISALKDMQDSRLKQNLNFLDNLPVSPSGRIQMLMDYDFLDQQAHQEFQDLLAQLKSQMANNISSELKDQMQEVSPEQIKQMKDMVQALIEMLRDKAEGIDPGFEEFMDKFGDMFAPDKPDTFEELLELLSQQFSQMQSMLDSMSPDARRELEDSLNAALDPELQGMMAQMAELLGQILPMSDLSRQYPFLGDDTLSMSKAREIMEQLQDLDKLEQALREAARTGDLSDVDIDALESLLGDDARAAFEEMERMVQMLKDAGYLDGDEKLQLTARGMRKIGQKALKEVFVNLKKDRLGGHETDIRGAGGDILGDTKPYEFGDPLQLDMQATLKNGILRSGTDIPVRISPEDFEIYREEHSTRAATVVLLDQSRSMELYNNFQAAKKVTLALLELIKMQYPRDSIDIVGFSLYAQEISEKALATSSWNMWDSGTNLQHGLMLARKLLSKHRGSTQQILLITDGEPTAHLENGQAYFNYPPSYRTELETLKQVRQCTREGIIINTFMLENNYQLVNFVDNLTRINRGRAFYSSSDSLGQYVLVDYISSRRKRIAA